MHDLTRKPRAAYIPDGSLALPHLICAAKRARDRSAAQPKGVRP